MQNFSFPDWDSPLAEKIEALFSQLPGVDSPHAMDPVMEAQGNMELGRRLLYELRNLIEDYEFKSAAEEIRFFKEVKPLFSASLLFWSRLFQLRLHQPVGGRGIIRKYWKSELQYLSRLFEQHIGFYEYLRSKDTEMDGIYFLRNHKESENNSVSPDLNPRFTTAKDHLVAKILASDKLEQYIVHFLRGEAQPAPVLKLQWTASKANLVELIYALQSGGVYNNGQSEIKEIAETFEQFFQVDLGNYYHVFNEIRLRKKNRTSFLDQLREKVLQKMDALDEK
jgi:hypothetical protein